MILTHGCNNLGLHSKLALEAASKVCDATFPVLSDIGHFSDMIEHVARCEKENQNETDCSPKVSVLNDRHDVGVCNGSKCEETHNDGD